MLAFIDASGDPGLKILNRSSRYFVVALVTFEEPDAEGCDARIDRLRSLLKLSPGYEFHFSDNSPKIREEFLKTVTHCRFFYHTYALSKHPESLKSLGIDRADQLFNYVIHRTYESAKSYLNSAKVIIDGQRSDRRFRDRLAAFLRREVRGQRERGLIRNVSVQRSSGNNLLQLADYVAGVTNRALDARPDGATLRRYLDSHQRTWQVWPETIKTDS